MPCSLLSFLFFLPSLSLPPKAGRKTGRKKGKKKRRKK
jgi:hypothetical protein